MAKVQPHLVKIFDEEKNYLGKGNLDSLSGTKIIVKGNYLPTLPSKSTIFLNIYNEIAGIAVYECLVSLAADMQLSAKIVKYHTTIERRKSLKVRTDYKTELKLVMRENNIVQCEEPIKIKILNLSVGGMLFTSITDFCLGDAVVFNFDYYKNNVIPIEAKIIRIDEPSDEFSNYNYGCVFKDLSNTDESVLYQYLYERQLQVHKKNNY
jgi:hypothetical protein